MKKIIIIFFTIFALLISTSITSFAYDCQANNANSTCVIDEVSIISHLQSLSDVELHNKGFSNNEISQIRAFNYDEELRNRAALDDEVLYLYGYSNQEIEELRKYVNSNGAKGSISSITLTTNLSLTGKTVSSSYRKATFKFTWEWNRLPFIKLFDSIGAVWESLEGDQFVFLANGTNSVKLVFEKINPDTDGPNVQYYYQTWSAVNYRAIESKFGISTESYFVMSGEGIFQMESTSGTGRLYIEAGYAHLTVGLSSPSVSIGSDGCFNFSLEFSLINDTQIKKILYNSNLTVYQTYS